MKTPWVLAALAEIERAEPVRGSVARIGDFTSSLCFTAQTLWLKVLRRRTPVLAIRLVYAPDETLRVESDDAAFYNVATSYGRARVELKHSDVIRAKVSMTPFEQLCLTNWPRDLVALTDQGEILTRQRGLRSGIVYARSPEFGSFMYFQNYSSLSAYFERTGTSPADRISGAWPEVGFALPANEGRPLPAGQEFCISDVALSLADEEPSSDGTIARAYLDHLALIYCSLDRPNPEYHDWIDLAEQSLLALSHSNQCTQELDGHTYLSPYAGDKSKPPESMVQLTVLLPMREYAAWSERPIPLADIITRSIPSFVDSKINCLVRWPDGKCAPGPPDVGANQRYMDSWYLYHALFNLGRLAKRTQSPALRDILGRSLLYARRVAHRFDYRFPVFFDLDTLEVLRAEAREGAGGENDVCGLYVSVMLQAHEILSDDWYLEEAMEAAKRLRGLGFGISYQLNATGFAAEGLLRLYLLTGNQEYLDLSYLCLANVLDNSWLWDGRYGNAKSYPTFFGIFPLPDAPYLAAYEELEDSAKFREYLRLANDRVAPSIRLLLAEYCRYVLDRAWYYFPRNLPREALAEHTQSGHLSRELAVPVEDLHDGWSPSGTVGQEVYGAGIAPGLAVRHYSFIESLSCWLFCDYPAFELRKTLTRGATTLRLSIAGDKRGCCSVRIIPADMERHWSTYEARAGRTRIHGEYTAQGHLLFRVPGGSLLSLRFRR